MQEAYNKLVSNKKLKPDASQNEFIELLSDIEESLKKRLHKNLLSKYLSKALKLKQFNKSGLYVHGGVGRGKSYLLNLFLKQFDKKYVRRQHFHQFMQATHKLLEIHRQKAAKKGSKKSSNAILKDVVKNICGNYKIFFVDELFVKNIADAMLVVRIFRIMKRAKVFVIFASNRPPDELYLNGLQRNRFLEFIDMVENHYIIHNLDHTTDYREKSAKSLQQKLFFGDEAERNKFLHSIKESLNLNAFETQNIEIEANRFITVKKTCGQVAMFSFEELCLEPKSIKDYNALCNQFKTIVVHDIPILNDSKHNAVMRFINFIDCIYDSNVNLIATFKNHFSTMYTGKKYAFEFERTISRLKHFE